MGDIEGLGGSPFHFNEKIGVPNISNKENCPAQGKETNTPKTCLTNQC